MAAVMPKTRPWTTPPRGSSDGVKERQPKMSAPQQPGSVRYSSFRGFLGSAAGSGPSAAASAERAAADGAGWGASAAVSAGRAAADGAGSGASAAVSAGGAAADGAGSGA